LNASGDAVHGVKRSFWQETAVLQGVIMTAAERTKRPKPNTERERPMQQTKTG